MGSIVGVLQPSFQSQGRLPPFFLGASLYLFLLFLLLFFFKPPTDFLLHRCQRERAERLPQFSKVMIARANMITTGSSIPPSDFGPVTFPLFSV